MSKLSEREKALLEQKKILNAPYVLTRKRTAQLLKLRLKETQLAMQEAQLRRELLESELDEIPEEELEIYPDRSVILDHEVLGLNGDQELRQPLSTRDRPLNDSIMSTLAKVPQPRDVETQNDRPTTGQSVWDPNIFGPTPTPLPFDPIPKRETNIDPLDRIRQPNYDIASTGLREKTANYNEMLSDFPRLFGVKYQSTPLVALEPIVSDSKLPNDQQNENTLLIDFDSEEAKMLPNFNSADKSVEKVEFKTQQHLLEWKRKENEMKRFYESKERQLNEREKKLSEKSDFC